MTLVVTLRPLNHKQAQHIAIGFTYNEALKTYVKGFSGVRWSATHKTFYVGYSKGILHQLFEYLRAGGYYVDYSALKDSANNKVIIEPKPKPPNKYDLHKALTKEQRADLKGFIDYLKGKRLSEQTISVYGYFILRFLYYTRDIARETLETKHIALYMSDVIAKERYSISSHRQCVSAFKYLTAFYGLPGFDASTFERPKKSKYLPSVLSEIEIIRLIQATKNLKHRVIIGLLYSGGLRIGELLGLKLADMDFERNQLFVRQGKGRKDRVVTMSTVIKPMLHNYITTYQPKLFVVEGRNGNAYSAASVRQFLKRSCKLAGIKKTVTPHTLRHSYATHMLEHGVDLRYIQELLGHAKPETTMVYTHVAKKQFLQIQNPLDVAVAHATKSVKSNKKVLLSGNKTD
ncbi:tyrosine-type recombinase/integrase [Hanstruepera marina]|uniref:tyrosine-type recombinase/integrase n=1 Tax=Hanstruepera marina TaxID=2873265 RepID=UPI001CA71DFB|nr:tyrosine-type recombinase/integrase [Hanstruepera marina]